MYCIKITGIIASIEDILVVLPRVTSYSQHTAWVEIWRAFNMPIFFQNSHASFSRAICSSKRSRLSNANQKQPQIPRVVIVCPLQTLEGALLWNAQNCFPVRKLMLPHEYHQCFLDETICARIRLITALCFILLNNISTINNSCSFQLM